MLLVFFPGLDFTVSLLACFMAGVIAVPVFPPDPRRLKKDLHHFVNIQISSGAQVVLTNSQYSFVKKVENLKSMFSTSSTKWPVLQWIQIDEIIRKGKSLHVNHKEILKRILSEEQKREIQHIDVAFLQYTSGSTSDPKGVMISHGNLAHNLKIIIHELRASPATINVSWLPQYHDMGLIGIIYYLASRSTQKYEQFSVIYRFVFGDNILRWVRVLPLSNIFSERPFNLAQNHLTVQRNSYSGFLK